MIKDELYMRTDILKDNGVINQEVSDVTYKLIDYFCEQELEAEKLTVFTTHFSMMLERIRKGETEEAMADAILAELKTNAAYDKAAEFLAYIKEISTISIPEEEVGYLLIHLCNLAA